MQMSDEKACLDSLVWRIMAVDAWQYFPSGDDQYLRFELRNEEDMTSLEVVLPWTGKLTELMAELEAEVRKRIVQRLGM